MRAPRLECVRDRDQGFATPIHTSDASEVPDRRLANSNTTANTIGDDSIPIELRIACDPDCACGSGSSTLAVPDWAPGSEAEPTEQEGVRRL